MSNKSIPDVISLLIKIQDTKQYLFTIGHNQNIFLPSTSLSDNDSWRDVSSTLAEQILSITPPNINICRVYRLYCPSQNYAMNIIYEVTLSSETLAKCKVQPMFNGMPLEWVSHANAIKNMWMSQKYWKCLFIPKSERESFVYEITMKETLITMENTDAVHHEMISVANISEDDQKFLCREFMRITWPENLMLMSQFKTFCNTICSQMEEEDFIERLFKAADVQDRNCLSFRDVLYILAASSPVTPHNGACLDIRTQYIFKYFDNGSKGHWNDTDLKEVIHEMNDRKGKKLTDIDLDKETVCARK